MGCPAARVRWLGAILGPGLGPAERVHLAIRTRDRRIVRVGLREKLGRGNDWLTVTLLGLGVAALWALGFGRVPGSDGRPLGSSPPTLTDR